MYFLGVWCFADNKRYYRVIAGARFRFIFDPDGSPTRIKSVGHLSSEKGLKVKKL